MNFVLTVSLYISSFTNPSVYLCRCNWILFCWSFTLYTIFGFFYANYSKMRVYLLQSCQKIHIVT